MVNYYIYKYVLNSKTAYLGQTEDLERRHRQHLTEEKFINLYKQGDVKLYYFICKSKGAMNRWEIVLINKYHPELNVINKDESIIIKDIKDPDWILYDKNDFSNKEKQKIKPATQEAPKERVVKQINIDAILSPTKNKTVYKNSNDSFNMINKNASTVCNLNLGEIFWKEEYTSLKFSLFFGFLKNKGQRENMDFTLTTLLESVGSERGLYNTAKGYIKIHQQWFDYNETKHIYTIKFDKLPIVYSDFWKYYHELIPSDSDFILFAEEILNSRKKYLLQFLLLFSYYPPFILNNNSTQNFQISFEDLKNTLGAYDKNYDIKRKILEPIDEYISQTQIIKQLMSSYKIIKEGKKYTFFEYTLNSIK